MKFQNSGLAYGIERLADQKQTKKENQKTKAVT